MKVVGWAVLILLCLALVFMLGNSGDNSSAPEPTPAQVTSPSDSSAPPPSTEDTESTSTEDPQETETNTALRTDDQEETAQLATDNVEKEQAEENSQIDYSVLDIPEQDVNLALGAVKIINSENIQWVACPSVDEMRYLTNFYEKLRTTHERDDAQTLAESALSHFNESRCVRMAEDLVLAFTDTPSQTSSYLDSNVSFIQVTVYRITGDDGGTENLGNYWIVQEFVANSKISSPVKVRRTQSTQRDSPTPPPSPAEKPKGKIVTVTGDYLIVCSNLSGLRSITSIDLSDYPEEVIPQLLDNARCRFLYPGDQLRLLPEAPTEGDFVKLPVIDAGGGDEYEMWTSTGFIMVYTDIIGVR